MRTTTIRHGRYTRRGTGKRSLAQRRVVLSDLKRVSKSRRGFAAMDPKLQRRIAREGGLTVSRNRKHMAKIGRVGGQHSHRG